MWVLFTLVDSGIVVYERFVGGLSDEREGGLLGGLPGRRRALRSRAGADAGRLSPSSTSYRELMYASGRLHVSDWARTKAREIVFQPPVPITPATAGRGVNYSTVALLPEPIRAQYGFAPIPPALLRGLTVGPDRRVHEANRAAAAAGRRAADPGGPSGTSMTGGRRGARGRAEGEPDRPEERSPELKTGRIGRTAGVGGLVAGQGIKLGGHPRRQPDPRPTRPASGRPTSGWPRSRPSSPASSGR